MARSSLVSSALEGIRPCIEIDEDLSILALSIDACAAQFQLA